MVLKLVFKSYIVAIITPLLFGGALLLATFSHWEPSALMWAALKDKHK